MSAQRERRAFCHKARAGLQDLPSDRDPTTRLHIAQADELGTVLESSPGRAGRATRFRQPFPDLRNGFAAEGRNRAL